MNFEQPTSPQHAASPELATYGPSYEPLIVALDAIKTAPDVATAEAMVTTYNRRFGQSFHESDPATNERPSDWTYCVLENFKRVVWGERDQWLPNLTTNLTWVPKAIRTRILALAGTDAPHIKVVGISAGIGYEPTRADSRAALRTEMERLLTGAGKITQSDVSNIVDLARHAALGEAAVTTARKLLVGYREMFFQRATGDAQAAELVKDIDWFRQHIATATASGILSGAFADDLRARVDQWRADALPKSNEYIAAKNEAAFQSVLQRAYTKLQALYHLKQSMDLRNGWTVRPAFSWRWEHDIATNLIEVVIPQLQAAADERDVDKIERAMSSYWMKQLDKHPKFNGDAVALAKYLEQQNKDGIAQGELLTDLISLTPIGPVAKLLAGTPIELLKYASGQQTLTETFVGIGLKAASGPFAAWTKLKGWSLFKTAIVNAIKGAIEDAAKNIAKVASSDLSWDAKFSMWDEIVKSAILSGLKEGLIGLPKEIFGNMTQEMLKTWLEAFADGLVHFGFKKPVEDEIKRFVEEEAARKKAEATGS